MKKKLHSVFHRHPFISCMVLILLFTLIEGSFSFCSKKPCAAFNDSHYDKWFPYQSGQIVYFKNNSSPPDTLIIGNASESGPYTTGGGYNSGTCTATASISSAIISANQPELQLEYDIADSYTHLEMAFDDFHVRALNLNDSGLVINNYSPIQSFFFNSVTLNNQVFNKVQLLEADTSGKVKPVIYKVWLSSGNGIVAYEKYNRLQQFIKQ